MRLKKVLAITAQHLLKSNMIQANLNQALVEDLLELQKRITKLEALAELYDERFNARIKKGK